jgi:hypothetical protein
MSRNNNHSDDTLFWVFVIYIVCITLLLSHESEAQTIYLGAWSKHRYQHTEEGVEYNETHNLVAVEYKDFFLGRFKNSYGNESWIVVEWFDKEVYPGLSLGLGLGGVSGYDPCAIGNREGFGDFCLAIVPRIKYRRGHFELNLIGLQQALALGPSFKF